MLLNLSNEMIHTLIRAAQTREDFLDNASRGDTEEASLLKQFEDMGYDVLHMEVEEHRFSWKESNKTLKSKAQ